MKISTELVDLWNEEYERLEDRVEDAQKVLHAFECVDHQEYPVMECTFTPYDNITTPCCGISTWHSGEYLHKCAFCRRYYFVVEAEHD